MGLRDRVIWALIIAAAWAFYSAYFYNWWAKVNVPGPIPHSSFGYTYLGALLVIGVASFIAYAITRRV